MQDHEKQLPYATAPSNGHYEKEQGTRGILKLVSIFLEKSGLPQEGGEGKMAERDDNDPHHRKVCVLCAKSLQSCLTLQVDGP